MEPRNQIRKHYRINPESYLKLGKAWIETKGGFVLGLEEGECQGVKFEQTPRQWGAWRAYFKERGIPTAFMDAKAKATATNKQTVNPHCWTVPTEWPHEFDSEATVQGDQEAANWFMRNYRPERLDLASAAQRAATVAAMRSRMPPPHQYQRYKPEPEGPKTTFIDKDKLLQDYEKDMAEWRARNAKNISPSEFPPSEKAA